MTFNEKYSTYRQSKQHWPLFSFNHTKPVEETLTKWKEYYQKVLSPIMYEDYFDLMLFNSIYILETEDATIIDEWILFQEHIFPEAQINSLDLIRHPNCHSDALNVLARMYLNQFDKPLDIIIEGAKPGVELNYAAFIGAPYLKSPITPCMDEIYKYKSLQALQFASQINTHNQLKNFDWTDKKLNTHTQYSKNNIDVKQRFFDYYGLTNITQLITSKEYIKTLFDVAPNSLYTFAQTEGRTSVVNYYIYFISRFNPEVIMPEEDLLSTYILLEYLDAINRPIYMDVLGSELKISPVNEIESFKLIRKKLQQKCEKLPLYTVIKLQMDNITPQNCIATLNTLEDLTNMKPITSYELPEL